MTSTLLTVDRNRNDPSRNGSGEEQTASADGAVPAGVAVIRLTNPPVNALSRELAEQLHAVVTEIAGDDRVRAVVVHGSPKAFAAGADIAQLQHTDHTTIIRNGLPVERAVARLAALTKPVIAAVTGYALGGGCELALAADYRISAEDAQWGLPEILLGLIPGAGGTQRLTRLVGPGHAKDLIFSGRFIDGVQAHRIGLANTVLPAEEVVPTALELAARYAAGPATALAAAKTAVNAALDADLDTGLSVERSQFASLFSTQDKEVGIRSFLQNGPGKAVFTPLGQAENAR